MPKTEQISLEHLARRARAGDREAFISMIEQCKPTPSRVARSLLKQEEDVADAMQDTVLKAFQGIGSLKKPGYCKTWLTKICMNCCYELLRGRKTVLLSDYAQESGVEYEWDDPLDVHAALSGMSGNDRLLLTLFYMEDMSQKEIGQLLGVSENAVKLRIARAKRKFQSIYLKGDAVNE